MCVIRAGVRLKHVAVYADVSISPHNNTNGMAIVIRGGRKVELHQMPLAENELLLPNRKQRCAALHMWFLRDRPNMAIRMIGSCLANRMRYTMQDKAVISYEKSMRPDTFARLVA